VCQSWVSTNTASCWSRRQALAMEQPFGKTCPNSAAGKRCGSADSLRESTVLYVGREPSAVGRNAAGILIARLQKRPADGVSLRSVFVTWVVGRTPSFGRFW
jgi:hypothetical protein